MAEARAKKKVARRDGVPDDFTVPKEFQHFRGCPEVKTALNGEDADPVEVYPTKLPRGTRGEYEGEAVVTVRCGLCGAHMLTDFEGNVLADARSMEPIQEG